VVIGELANSCCVHPCSDHRPCHAAVDPSLLAVEVGHRFEHGLEFFGCLSSRGMVLDAERFCFCRGIVKPNHEFAASCILENGEAALAFGSGMAAISSVIFSLCTSGSNFVSSNTLYGGTHQFFVETLPRYGIQAREVDGLDLSNFEQNIDPDTKCIYIETPANPTLTIIDIKGCAKIAHKHKIPLIVDNTFSTPYFQRPLNLGASIVVHSATKYIGGHGDTVAGLVVGKKDYIATLRNSILRDIGGIISPLC